MKERTKLARAIFDAGLSNRELARMCGVSECAISQAANDRRKPRLESCIRIADALGTTPEALGLVGLSSIRSQGNGNDIG
jgi:transcriptional regulator with XRE-family HTH domain